MGAYEGHCKHFSMGPFQHRCSLQLQTASKATFKLLGETLPLNSSSHDGDALSFVGDEWRLQGIVNKEGDLQGVLLRHGVEDGFFSLRPQQADVFQRAFDSEFRV